MEKAMVPHCGTLAWKIPWTEEPGRLQSMGSLWVGHDWATSLSLFTFMHWRRKWQPTPVFLPGESQGWGAWWASVSGVAQSRTWLKQLSSSSLVIPNNFFKGIFKFNFIYVWLLWVFLFAVLLQLWPAGATLVAVGKLLISVVSFVWRRTLGTRALVLWCLGSVVVAHGALIFV